MLLRTYTKEEVNDLVETEVNKVKTELTKCFEEKLKQIQLDYDKKLNEIALIINKKSKIIENLQWKEDTFSNAVLEGDLEKMKWLKENGCHFGNLTFYNAGLNGNLDNMKWLLENNCNINENNPPALSGAIQNGNINNLNWLKEHGAKFGMSSDFILRKEIEKNNLETIKWLIENGCNASDSMNTAVLNGNFEIIQYLKQNGISFNDYTFQHAIQKGNLEIIKWLKDNGCKINKNINLSELILKNNLELILWIIDNELISAQEIYTYAKQKENLKIIEFLKLNEYEFEAKKPPTKKK